MTKTKTNAAAEEQQQQQQQRRLTELRVARSELTSGQQTGRHVHHRLSTGACFFPIPRTEAHAKLSKQVRHELLGHTATEEKKPTTIETRLDLDHSSTR